MDEERSGVKKTVVYEHSESSGSPKQILPIVIVVALVVIAIVVFIFMRT